MGLFGKRKEKSDPVLNCPRDNTPMVKKSKMGVTIDKCEKCQGIWLDGGEIENILVKVNEERKKLEQRQNKAKKKK
jgi:hypothetical protein